MKRVQRRRLLNLFAIGLLAFAIYLNFFYKEKPANTESWSSTSSGQTAGTTAKTAAN